MASRLAIVDKRNGVENKLRAEDRAVHDWYRFVLSFPPHLVRTYLDRFDLPAGARVLDPFCGTGTTLVECKKRGVASVGIEANPMAVLASRVKTDWAAAPAALAADAAGVAGETVARLERDGIRDHILFPAAPPKGVRLLELAPEEQALLLRGSISPLPLHKTLTLLKAMSRTGTEAFAGHERLALARCLVQRIGNLHFGPEVGVGTPKTDAPVTPVWLDAVEEMARDLRSLAAVAETESAVLEGDARRADELLPPESVDAVITSPPYPNEKDYTRTTRLESVLLGLVRSKEELRRLKKGLVRSNTRSVYVEDADDAHVAGHAEIARIARAIENRRIELGKTSGFERLYPRVTKLYFGGMTRHLGALRRVLRPGAQLAYVVGDQASYLRVMIRTGQLLADIAESLGYEVQSIDLFRTRLATATREQLREEVVVLRWPGPAAGVAEKAPSYGRRSRRKGGKHA
jgi:hypothetical protein